MVTMGKRVRSGAGFTLIEMILTIIIVGIVAGVTAKLLLSGMQAYNFVVNRKDAVQTAGLAMENMVNEFTSKIYSINLASSSNTKFLFQDTNYQTHNIEKVTDYNGNSIIQRDADYLAGPCGSLDFDYLAWDGSEASTASLIRKINIDFSIDTLGGESGSIPLKTEVFDRRFMYYKFEQL